VRWAIALGATIVAVAFLCWIRSVVFIAFVGVLLAVFLSAFADIFHRRLGLGWKPAVILAAILFAGALVGVVALVAVPLTEQASRFGEAVPSLADRARGWLEGIADRHPGLERWLPAIESRQAARASDVALTFLGVAEKLLQGIVAAVAIFFIGIFLALDPQRYAQGLAALIPGPNEDRVGLLVRIGQALRQYLTGLGIQITVMSVLWTAGLFAIGIDYFLLFGIVGGLFEVVPYFGPLIGLLPPLLVALAQSPETALTVVAVYLVLQLIESHVMSPYVFDRQVHLPPAVAIGGVLAFGTAFGFWGIFLAMPILTVVYVIVQEVYLRPRTAADAGDGPFPAAAPASPVTP